MGRQLSPANTRALVLPHLPSIKLSMGSSEITSWLLNEVEASEVNMKWYISSSCCERIDPWCRHIKEKNH
jgi:hypothetical protein